ncbi:regulator [Acinetobacter brisouii]|uniref:regulator n=1 Tax=Acinetobacter brisouii TaxID=396323 RepID=UPI00124EC452|nr:regulator [Acinetobacter brisouii]
MQLDVTKLLATAKNKSNAIKSRADTYKLKDGANRIVLLAGWRKGEENVFYHDFGTHFIKDSLESSAKPKATYLCLDKTYGRDCPVCEAIALMGQQATTDDQVELVKQCRANPQYLLNVLALDSDAPNDPQVLSIGKIAFGAILDLLEEWGAAVFDPQNPQVITINREGKGFNTKYTVQVSPRKINMNATEVYGKIHNLDEFVAQENEENMKRALNAVKGMMGSLPAPVQRPAEIAYDDMRVVEGTASVVPSTPAPTLDQELDDLFEEL